ncbi:hypothetical protein L6R52_35270 [Myxococcota bacterium]|nr:hypothetical protein [Myxococcota bacterium]
MMTMTPPPSILHAPITSARAHAKHAPEALTRDPNVPPCRVRRARRVSLGSPSRSTATAVALWLALAACTESGDVLFTPADAGTTPDAGTVRPDATASPDASVEPDAGTADGGPDAGPIASAWTRLPGLHGGSFRHAGESLDDAFVLGRRLDESLFSVFRLGGDGVITRMSHPTEEDGAPLFPPIGRLVELDGRLLWATESAGIVASEDRGETWSALTLDWEDGSVGNGDGHVSRLLDAWSTGEAFCVHREVTPWIEFRVRDELRYNEVRCLDGETWTTVTSSIAEGVRFFVADGEALFGFTAPLYNAETGAPKLCRSEDLGVTWTCRPTTLHEGTLDHTRSGRLVVTKYVDVEQPTPATHTELWISDDAGETWTLRATIPTPITEHALVGDVYYGASYMLDVVLGPTYEVALGGTGFEERAAPTRAQVSWLDMFAQGDDLLVATTRGVLRYDAATDEWRDVAIESMPALDVVSDDGGNVWTIDGSRIARRLRPGATEWEEYFFEDSGWASGGIVAHARAYQVERTTDDVFFGAAHRKVFVLPADTATPIAQEDTGLVSLLHPDAIFWRMKATGDRLYVAPSGGEEVNHGNGFRVPWGGGLYLRSATTGQWIDRSRGLPTRPADVNGNGIVAAIHAEGEVVVVATQAGAHHSTDEGNSWTPVGGLLAWDAVEEPTVIAGSGARVLLARRAADRTFLYASSDGGATFAAVAGPAPSGRVRALAVEGDTYYALADGQGLLVSDDLGRTWRPIVEGATLPPIGYALSLEPTRILVGTSHGVWSLAR